MATENAIFSHQTHETTLERELDSFWQMMAKTFPLSSEKGFRQKVEPNILSHNWVDKIPFGNLS